jgi:hypothetical protein
MLTGMTEGTAGEATITIMATGGDIIVVTAIIRSPKSTIITLSPRLIITIHNRRPIIILPNLNIMVMINAPTKAWQVV